MLLRPNQVRTKKEPLDLTRITGDFHKTSVEVVGGQAKLHQVEEHVKGEEEETMSINNTRSRRDVCEGKEKQLG